MLPISMRWNQSAKSRLDRFLQIQRSRGRQRIANITKGLTMPDINRVTIGSAKRMTTAVLFFDLEDFTATTSSIPNEQTLNMLNIIIPTIMMLIRSYKGEVEKNTGDGVMAIFGSETRDNFEIARDAVEGAMTIRAAMLHHVQPLLERDLLPVMNFRIGIDMGEILVARIGNPTISFLTAVGSAANRAAKLQSLADTNGICIGENLYHHIYPELQYYCDERDDKEWDWFVTELNRRAYKFYDLTAQWVD